jgi:hypothetical protein
MMRRWLTNLADAVPFERLASAVPFERRQPPPSGPGVGTGGLGLAALLLGAGLMYFFDPEAGARRRGVLGTTLRDLARRMGMALDDASRDMVNRAREVGVVRRPMTAESQLP